MRSRGNRRFDSRGFRLLDDIGHRYRDARLQAPYAGIPLIEHARTDDSEARRVLRSMNELRHDARDGFGYPVREFALLAWLDTHVLLDDAPQCGSRRPRFATVDGYAGWIARVEIVNSNGEHVVCLLYTSPS